MKLEIDAARLLVWRASWMGRTGKPFTSAEGSMSKLKAGEVAVWATERAIQILGGNGYTREYPVERMAPRRQDLHDLRGHLGDPAARHRARDLGGPDPVDRTRTAGAFRLVELGADLAAPDTQRAASFVAQTRIARGGSHHH